MNQQFRELCFQVFGKHHEILLFEDGCLELFYELVSQKAYADGYHAGVRMKELLNDNLVTKPTKAWVSCDIRPVGGKPVWVYDPKPSVEYGPDVHKAYWDSNYEKWIGADEDVDPFDISPSVWFCEDLSLIEMKD